MTTFQNSMSGEAALPPSASLAAGLCSGRYLERFELIIATAHHDRPDILAAWQRMLAEATGPETLYQSPQFFNYLIDMGQGKEATYELFVVRRRIDHAIVGVVPVRTIDCDVDFRVGPVSLFKRSLRACQILGSVPLLDPAEAGLTEFVIQQLLDRYVKCQVLYMQSVPEENAAILSRVARVSTYVLNGWRPCHTQPLPDSVDGYLQKFNSKKRYNLSRQVRLLTVASGPLQVLCIEQPEQVAAMLDAMIAMDSSPGEQRDVEQARLAVLARHGLLLSYVIRCGDEDVAVVYGSRSAAVWHIHKISCLQKYLYLSVGTSAIHLAVQDVLARFAFKVIDFGYGTPNSEFRSTHVLQVRGHVLLHRSSSLTGLLLKAHRVVNGTNEALIRQFRRLQNRQRQRRLAAKARTPT